MANLRAVPHGAEGSEPESSAEVRARRDAPTGTEVKSPREQSVLLMVGTKKAAECVAKACERTYGQRGLARHLGEGVSDTLVAGWCHADSGKNFPLKAAFAGPADFRAEIGRTLIADAEAEMRATEPQRTLTDSALGLQEEIGVLSAKVRRALADQVVTEAEREGIDRCLAQIIEQAMADQRALWRGGGK